MLAIASGVRSLDEQELFANAESLHREADELLRGGNLLEILSRFGVPVPVGSYALNLMTYRDLDVYVVREAFDVSAFFQLGTEIATRMKPHRLQFRNEVDFRTGGLPLGLYWGVYTNNDPARAWKIDIWAMEPAEHHRLTKMQADIAARLDDGARRTVLAIKSALCTSPEYRKEYGGYEIYCAVLDAGVKDVDGFREYLRSHPSGRLQWRR